jgi:Holliday junction resolvase RusA-like endonuclease
MYNVPAVKEWKKKVKDAAFLAQLQSTHQSPAEGVPVRVDFNFYLQWQKNVPKKVAAFNGDHTSKPDLSNLIKHTEDALTEANMWADDNQIDTLTAQKFRCARGEQRVDWVISW